MLGTPAGRRRRQRYTAEFGVSAAGAESIHVAISERFRSDVARGMGRLKQVKHTHIERFVKRIRN